MKNFLAFWLLSCSTHNATAQVQTFEDVRAEVIGCTGLVKLEGLIDDPEDFVNALKACEHRAVVVEINSPGGSVMGAWEMQKAIERHPYPVVCVVDGMAASAAFVTLQACDIRGMTDRSVLMAHHASARVGGQSQDAQNLANALRVIDRAMALYCATRMGMNPDDFERNVAGGREWWMGLEDALRFKAVDFRFSSVAEAMALVQPADAP